MQDINYIKHLNGVFNQFSKDTRLNPTHISLYVALFQIWNNYHFKESFFINRSEVMDLSKLGSKTTYHRCVKELSHWKYIMYEPSHNPFRGSKIKMFNFGTSGEQVSDFSYTNIETSYEQVLVSKDKRNKTIRNNSNISKQKKYYKKDSKNRDKQKTGVPFEDNLQIIADKDYNEPL